MCVISSTTYNTTDMHPDMMERGAKACPAELGFPFDESYKLNMHFPNLLQCWVLGCDKGSQRSQKSCWPCNTTYLLLYNRKFYLAMLILGYYAMRRTSGKDAKECAGQHNLLGEIHNCSRYKQFL
ncbi:uncharacterized protein LOC124648476 [Lolium rigidum]|uniref:uncharacterized protein LOC124648476 n=1 Tax=Lolium rigidum TaxID=89674 RepID=UPI001F5D932B|nr:uncharacterized protein LOC124648476 [Lolium rigidum]